MPLIPLGRRPRATGILLLVSSAAVLLSVLVSGVGGCNCLTPACMLDPVCGDGSCDRGEACYEDCCGNGDCTDEEEDDWTGDYCQEDCYGVCGDGICHEEEWKSSSSWYCPPDCVMMSDAGSDAGLADASLMDSGADAAVDAGDGG